MRIWIPILVLGVIGLGTGGALEILHLHRTIGLGGIALGAILILAGAGGTILRRQPPEGERRKPVSPANQRGAVRRAIVAVLVVVLIGIATFYGASYLAGTQSGGSQSAPTTSSQSGATLPVTGSSSITGSISVVTSGTISTALPSTETSSTATTSSVNTSSQTTSQSTMSVTASNGSTSTTESVTSVTSSSLTTTTQSSSKSTGPAKACETTTKSLDGFALDYTSTNTTSGSVQLVTQRSGDVIIVFTTTITTPEGTGAPAPTVAGIAEATRRRFRSTTGPRW